VTTLSGLRYTLLRGSHYCLCSSYQYNVVGREGDITCKHLLLGDKRLAMAMQGVSVETVLDRQIMHVAQQLAMSYV
jgi:predicted nucleic acid-binding Zn finger protein